MTRQAKSYYITGFSSASGRISFKTSFRLRKDSLLGWKISPVFTISHKQREKLAVIKSHFQCGTLRLRKDGVWVYQVDNRNTLKTHIVPSFENYPFLSTKNKRNFHRFKKIIQVLDGHKNTTLADLQEICQLIEDIDSKSSRKFSNQHILTRAQEFWTENREKINHLNARHHTESIILRDYTPNDVPVQVD